MTTESRTERRILQCVDQGLQVMGESSKEAIYHYLRNDFRLERAEIPNKPEIFCKGLKTLFGEEGAEAIRGWIIEKLKGTFHLKCHSRMTFAKAVDKIMNKSDEHPQPIGQNEDL